jgi:4-amino-4-deoxy-L-arabinose transferase-like glycosyltransferase
LTLVLLLGSVLRLYRLGANSLWIDEFSTLDLARHSPADILRLSSSANFIPPLYFLLVHGALQVLGESEVALRLWSAVAGIATIPVVWLLTRDMTGSRPTADFAATLLAISPLHLWYSQEARPYSLLLFFGCCSLLALQRAAQTNSMSYWILFTVSSALAFLTHTTAVILGAVAWIWVLWTPGKRHLIRPLFISSLAAVLLCTPSVLAITGAFAATHGTFHTAPRAITGLELPYTLFTYIGGYSFGPSPREIQDFGALAALRNNPFQSAIAGAALLAVLLILWLNRRATMVPFLVLLAISLAGVFALAALSGKPYNVRYTLPGLIGFLVSMTIAGRTLKPRVRALALAVPVGIAAIGDAQWFWVSRYWKEDTRAAVTLLRDRVRPGASVAVAPSYSIPVLQYYALQAGADLRFISAEGGSGQQTKGSPDALVLTRLHHVPDWRALRAGFIGQRESGLVQRRVPGYDMLLRPAPINP